MSSHHTVALTKQDVYEVLVLIMGWEDEDVNTFWRIAKKRVDARNAATLQRLKAGAQ